MILEILAILLLSIHLLLVNIASAAPLFCIYLERQVENRAALYLGRRLAIASIITLISGIIVGLLLGFLSWGFSDGQFVSILPRFTWKISWGIAEIFFSLACMAIYIRMWDRSAVHRKSVFLHRSLAILASTNLLYHFPSLFGAMTYVARNHARFGDSISTGEFRRIAYSNDVLPMTVHFLFASIAVTGVYVMCQTLGNNADQAGTTLSERNRIRQGSARIALAATLFQIIVGTWLLVKTEPLQQNRLLGDNLFATSSLGTSVLLTFVLCHFLATASFGEDAPENVRRSAYVIVIVVVLMTAALRQSRGSDLARMGSDQGAACSIGSLPSESTIRTTLSCPAKTTVSPVRLLLTA
ncbi:MAG: hypothetical protein P8N76_27905 [Pirellulaceae bacterium]|nr:hypothetical protein [Pirellulaceae bacterium]